MRLHDERLHSRRRCRCQLQRSNRRICNRPFRESCRRNTSQIGSQYLEFSSRLFRPDILQLECGVESVVFVHVGSSGLAGAFFLDPLHHAHALHNRATNSAQVNTLTAFTKDRLFLNDSDRETTFCEPPRQRVGCDTPSRYQTRLLCTISTPGPRHRNSGSIVCVRVRI